MMEGRKKDATPDLPSNNLLRDAHSCIAAGEHTRAMAMALVAIGLKLDNIDACLIDIAIYLKDIAERYDG